MVLSGKFATQRRELEGTEHIRKITEGKKGIGHIRKITEGKKGIIFIANETWWWGGAGGKLLSLH